MWLKGTPRVIDVPAEKPLVNFRGWKLHWGWAVVYDDGVRSQHARISRLYVPPHLRQNLKALAREYAVPVSVRKFPVAA